MCQNYYEFFHLHALLREISFVHVRVCCITCESICLAKKMRMKLLFYLISLENRRIACSFIIFLFVPNSLSSLCDGDKSHLGLFFSSTPLIKFFFVDAYIKARIRITVFNAEYCISHWETSLSSLKRFLRLSVLSKMGLSWKGL